MSKFNFSELEEKKISTLFWKYSIPAVVGMLVVALYNIIDSIYIGHGPGLGDHAIGGLGLVLPIMSLVAAIGFLVATGASSRISLYLGRNNKEGAEHIVGNALLLVILLTSLLTIGTYYFLDDILHAVGATDETFFYAKEFLIYYLPSNVFLTINFTFTSIMRASGYPKKSMIMMFIGVVLNIILAPIFIFELEWGMKGAGIATTMSIIAVTCLVMPHFFNKKHSLLLLRDKINLKPKIIWEILSIGFSPFIIQFFAAMLIFIVNNRLRVYGGSVAIEAFTIANRLFMVTIMILSGITQGIQPIIGYNYGASNYERVRELLYYAIKVAVIVGFIGAFFGVVYPDVIVKPFNPSPALAQSSKEALRILAVLLPLSGFQMIISNYFQSIGRAGISITLNLTRQLVFYLPALFILSNYLGVNGVLLASPVSDFLASLLAFMMFRTEMQKFKRFI